MTTNSQPATAARHPAEIDDPDVRFVLLALLFGGLLLLAGLTLDPYALRGVAIPPDNQGVLLFALMFGVLLLISYRVRAGIYISLSPITLAAALLTLGLRDTVLVVLLGAVGAAGGHQIFYRALRLPHPTLHLQLIRIGFFVGVTCLTALVGAWIGSGLALLTTGEYLITVEMLPLLVVVWFVVLTGVEIGAGLLWNRWEARLPAFRPFFDHSPFRNNSQRAIGVRVALINALSLVMGVLLALIYKSLPLLASTTAVGIVIGSIVIYRLTEVSRAALTRRVLELSLITQFGQSLSQNLPMPQLLDALYQQLQALMLVDLCVVGVYQKTSDSMTVVYARQGDQPINWPQPHGTGLLDMIGRSRKPLLLRGDVYSQVQALGVSPFYPPLPVCYLAVPLLVGDHLVGVISIEHLSNPLAYGESELAILNMLAPQAAIALRNAELYGRLSSLTGELAELNHLTHSINTVQNQDRALQLICQKMLTLLRADRASIMLVSEDGSSASLAVSLGLSASYLSHYQHIRLDERAEQLRFLKAKQPVMISDIQSMSTASSAWQSIAAAEGFRAVASVPMYNGDHPLGTLTIYYDQPQAIAPEDMALLTTLANQVNAAVANARLFREVQQHADDMTRLVASSYTLIESLDVHATGQQVADHLLALLALDLTAVYLPDPESNQLQRLALAGRTTAPLELPNTPSLRALRRLLNHPSEGFDSTSGYRLTDSELISQFEMQTAFALPLTAHGSPIGVVILGSIMARRFSAREWQLAETILNQAATALENATLFHLVDTELEERIRQLQAIENVSRKLTLINSLSLDTVIGEVLRAALSVTYADMASCGLREGDLMRFTVQTRPSIQVNELTYQLQGITGRVMRTCQPELVPDVSIDPDYVLVIPGTRSELAVPILIRGEAIGVLDLETTRENGFSMSQLTFMTTLADHTALAIEQAGLFSEIQRRNEQMRVILDSTYNGMILISADSRLIEANAAAERLLNRSLAPYIGRHILRLTVDLLHDGQFRPSNDKHDGQVPLVRPAQAAFNLVKNDPYREVQYFYQLHTDDGVTDVEAFSIPIVGDKGHIAARLIVLQDATQEKRIQRFRDQMIDMVVHDLRSPLANVVTSLNMVADMLLSEANTDMAEQVLDIATQNTFKVIQQVESILELRKMESGTIELTRSPTRLSGLVNEAMRTLEATAINAEIRLLNHIDSDLPLADIDGSQIARVLVNLIDNALKYTPSGGEVRIEAERMASDQLLLIRIVDTGPGIPLTMRRQVFDLFVTNTSKVLRGRRGMGLGLTFCQLVVTAHGGTIWADVGPEGGAAICFTLPIAPAIESSAPIPG